MKKNLKTKTHNLYKIVFLFVVFLGIGYAFLEANLNINGDVTVEAPELNVYVQSTSVTSGSTTGTPTIIGNDKKEVDFTTALTNDGNSFFEETTTVVNKGTGIPYLLDVDIKVYNSNGTEVALTAPYEYSLTKSDGTLVKSGGQLGVGNTESFKFKFNYISGTDMTQVTDYPTYTFKITYNYVLEYIPFVCSDNVNLTALSVNKCLANEHITPAAGTICKRAIKLHQEQCNPSDNEHYCVGSGYSQGDTITYGNCGTSGMLTSGDAFTCDVNGDGEFNELTERFYYVSDYYNTSTKSFDTSTATLVYYNSVKDGVACNNSRVEYYAAAPENWHGPETAKGQLPTTSQWSNVTLKSTTRAILAEYKTTHDSPTTAGGTLPTDFSYSGYSARLLTAKEIMNGCNLTEIVGNYLDTYGELDNCNYLFENTKYSDTNIDSYGPWLETPVAPGSGYTNYSLSLDSGNRYAGLSTSNSYITTSARPTIEVPKTSMSY